MDLAQSLWTQFIHEDNKQDFGEALQLCQTALLNCLPGNPNQVEIYLAVAKIQLGAYEVEHLKEYLHSSMMCFDSATTFKPSNITLHTAGSIMWACTAELLQHAPALNAYTRSLQFLDSYISIAASPSSRHLSMKNFPTILPVEAASCALHCGNIP